MVGQDLRARVDNRDVLFTSVTCAIVFGTRTLW